MIDLETRVQKTKNNVDEIVRLMSTWSKTPLFTRKEEKNDTLLNLTDRDDRLNKRYSEIKIIGEQIHGLLKVTSRECRNSLLGPRVWQLLQEQQQFTENILYDNTFPTIGMWHLEVI